MNIEQAKQAWKDSLYSDELIEKVFNTFKENATHYKVSEDFIWEEHIGVAKGIIETLKYRDSKTLIKDIEVVMSAYPRPSSYVVLSLMYRMNEKLIAPYISNEMLKKVKVFNNVLTKR